MSKRKSVLEKYGITEKQLSDMLTRDKPQSAGLIQKYFSGNRLKFAIVSDTHLCSKHERLDALKTFYKICKQQGIVDVYHAGDVITGQKLFRGMEYEVHTIGVDNQVNYCVRNYPHVSGITTHFITGNHDLSYYKDLGIDVGQHIASQRSDMAYLGQWQADVKYNNVIIRLIHPDKGNAYAYSYHTQKIVEQIQSGHKPHIMVFGHWHISLYFLYRNIHTLNAGCFEDQTPYLLRKGINPIIGGWIIKVKTAHDDKQSIIAFEPQFIPFY